MFFYNYHNDSIFTPDTSHVVADKQRVENHTTHTILKKSQEKKLEKKRVSWNPIVSIGDTYSKDEYDRRMDVVQIKQNIASAMIEKSLEFEFGFSDDIHEIYPQTGEDPTQYGFFSFDSH